MKPRAAIAVVSVLLCAACTERADPAALARDAEADAALEGAPVAAAPPTDPPARREVPGPARAPLVVPVEAVMEIRPRKPPYLPQPGVLVEFGTRIGDDDRTLAAVARARTGDDGWIDLALEVPDVDEPVWIWARPVDDGWQRRRAFARVEGGALAKPLAVPAIAGFTVRGSLVDEDAAPVPGLAILWVDERPRAHIEVDASGRFEWHLSRAERGRLSVASEGHGTALIDVSLDALSAATPLDIVVRGPGSLSGRVTDADGRPQAGLGLLVAAWNVEGVDVEQPRTWGPWRAVAAGGLRSARVSTDADGRFAVDGLALGPYRVRADVLGRSRYDAILTNAPVRAGARELELTVGAPRVSVQVVDERGAALPFVPFGPGQSLASLDWQPGVEHAVLVRHGDAQGGEGRSLAYDPWRSDPDGRRSDLVLEPESRYLVTLVTRGAPTRSEALYVEPRGRTTLQLRAPPATGAGRLRLRVRAPLTAPTGGRPRYGGLESFDLSLRASASGARVLETALSPTEAFERELPPGSYRLGVEPVASILTCGFGTSPEDFEVLPRPAERVIEIRSGELLDLELELEPAGQLLVGARLPGSWSGPAPDVRVLASNAAGEERALTFPAPRTLAADEFIDVDDLGLFDDLDDEEPAPPAEPTERVRAGAGWHYADVIAPGTWTLRVVGDGVTSDPVELTLGHGERKRVELELRAK